ncbi:transposable element Tcb2 transposase [Trichonephila clavipes]|nr:transposable element Tcb2 transposase [Trichonephila clavipes]
MAAFGLNEIRDCLGLPYGIRPRPRLGQLSLHNNTFLLILPVDIRPNLNPADHLWDVLEQGVKGHHTASMSLFELWTALTKVLQVIPMESFLNLVESMPRRMAAVIRARGGLNRY